MSDTEDAVNATIDAINTDFSHPYYFYAEDVDVDFSYSNINVEGLEAVHSAGWTGEGATVRVVDEFQGDYDYLIDHAYYL